MHEQLSKYLVGLILALGVGVSPGANAEPIQPVTKPRPNLVVLTLDTTRADHLGAWGWPHARTPNLDALAARGTRFERCDTAVPVTLPSHATLWTGRLPPGHGLRDNGTFVLADAERTLAEDLRAQGYDTGAVVSAVVLARRYGLAQGFRVYDDDLGAAASLGTQVAERPARDTTDAALRLIAGLKPPYFLWVHYYDPHEEYRPPSAFADRATGPHRLYDGEIAYMDSEIGRLLQALPPDTVVAAVGDHGEMLGEHGELSHGLLPFAGARRVPLLLAGPGVPSARTERCLARTVDLAPTLLALAGLTPPAGLDGAALLGPGAAALPAGTDPCAGPRALSYTESFLPFFAYRWYPLRALSDGRELFLQAPRPSLYDLASDAAEAVDLAPRRPAPITGWTTRLETLLRRSGESLVDFEAPAQALTPEQMAQLQSLGYLSGGGGGTVTADLPDPRDKTEIALALHRAAEGVQQGRCGDQLRELQRIVREDAHNFPALSLAAQCLRDLDRTAEALPLFRRAATENPRSAVPIVNVAQALEKLGELKEAEREFRHALAIDPALGEAAAHLAAMLRGRGERAAALEVLDRVLAGGAHEGEVHRERGLALAELGRLEEALSAFREAARRDPQDAVALEDAARAAFHLGRDREAVILYETLLRLRPADVATWKTLGAIYIQRLEDAAQASRCFREALRLSRDPAEREELARAVAELGG
jgi:tetratricopeptide (TPR) repeat protein